jgi:hypothetical protein
MNDVRLFGLLFAGYLALQIAVAWRSQLAFFRLTRAIYGPSAFLNRWPLPRVGTTGFIAAGLVLLAGCVAGAFGARAGFVAAALASLTYFGQIPLMDTVQRKVMLIPQILLVLALTPASGGPWSDPPDPRPLAIVLAMLALVYVAAGVAKLWRGGWRWADGHALQAYLIRADLMYDVPLARALATRLPTCAMLSVCVLAFELGGWLLLLSPRTRWCFAACGLAIHAGTLVLMRINYLKYHGAAYLVFAAPPLAGILARAGVA